MIIETTVKKQRIQRREETELKILREALASAMHWAWLCTGRGYALGMALRPLEELRKNNVELPRLLCV